MQEFRNYHAGSPMILCGNGPSLADVPTSFLEKYPLFVCNSFYLRPDAPAADWYLLELNNHKTQAGREERFPYVQRVGDAGGHTLVFEGLYKYFSHLPNVIPVKFGSMLDKGLGMFSTRPFKIYGANHSVLFGMLQFAYFLTDGPVLMVGVDHRLVGGWHFYPDEMSRNYWVLDKDEYESWQRAADPYFVLAARSYEKHGRTLLNLTPGSAATMFKSDKLENWL